jgi:hypothetical protein
MTSPAAALLNTRPASLEELRAIASAGRLYAVIDACDMPSVPEVARELGEERAVSLYRGSAQEMYWAFAPYLFAVDGEVLDWIVAELWSEPWGIFAVSDGDLEAVRRHFRRFLLVQAPDGEQWYFRFYDPRVIHPLLLSNLLATGMDDILGPGMELGIPVEGREVSFFRRDESVKGSTVVIRRVAEGRRTR